VKRIKDLESFGVSVKLGYKEMMQVDGLQELIEEETGESISAGKILRALIKEGLKNSQAVREELENAL
jgi:hypothetical protein